jgi:dienelactone hydrolase
MTNLRAMRLSWQLLTIWVFLTWIATSAFAQQTSPATPPPSLANHSGDTAQFPNFHEDWNTITLESSAALQPIPLVSTPKNDLPQNSFIRELYQVQWRPGDPMDLYVVRPRGVAKPPVVLYLYSYPQDTDRFKNDRWCTTVTEGGFAAVGFVSALTGHRYHDRPMKEWFVSELQESLAKSTHDVQMILNYLATRDDLDMSRVAMFGQGSGGAIAILASAADPRIKVLDLLDPWGDWPDWLAKSTAIPENERAAYLKPEFLAQVAPLDPVAWFPKVKAEHILLQDVRRDPIIPNECQERLEAAAPERATIDQFGNSRALYPVAAGGKVFDWMKSQLRSDGKTPTEHTERVSYFPPLGDPPLAAPQSK